MFIYEAQCISAVPRKWEQMTAARQLTVLKGINALHGPGIELIPRLNSIGTSMLDDTTLSPLFADSQVGYQIWLKKEMVSRASLSSGIAESPMMETEQDTVFLFTPMGKHKFW